MGDHLFLDVDGLVKPEIFSGLDERREMLAVSKSSSTSSSRMGALDERMDEANDEEAPLITMVECRICQDEDDISNIESPYVCSGSLKQSLWSFHTVEEDISDALNSTILDITKFVNSLVINKNSVYSRNSGFLTSTTDVVSKLQAFKLPVYVKLFQNNFFSQAWDFSDAYVELNSFVVDSGVDGVM